MKEAIKFYYDGISSDQMGLLNCTMNTGLYDEPFLSDRQIHEVQIRGNDEPYFQGVTRSPLSLTLTFAFRDTWDEEKIRAVARWLDQSQYKPFFTESNPDRIFYCVLVSSPKLLHNGLQQGYVELQFRCNSPHTFSPVYTSDIYDLSNNTVSTKIEFINYGDKKLYPEIWIFKVGAGDVSIINQSNGGLEFKFTGLVDAETVYVDNKHEHIETDLSNTYRFNNFNNGYLELVRGKNILSVTGKCKISMRYEFTTLQG